MKKAPWKDYNGNELFEGDKIIHPSGEVGKIVFEKKWEESDSVWFVNYGNDVFSQLCLQIGWKGQAVKVNPPSKTYLDV